MPKSSLDSRKQHQHQNTTHTFTLSTPYNEPIRLVFLSLSSFGLMFALARAASDARGEWDMNE